MVLWCCGAVVLWHPMTLSVEYEENCARAVRRVRRAAGLTQAQLAKALGVSRPRISELENGKHAFRLQTLHKIASALGVEPGDLLDELTFVPAVITARKRNSAPGAKEGA